MSIPEIQSKKMKAFNKIKRNYTAAPKIWQHDGKSTILIESLLSSDYQNEFLQRAWDILVVDMPQMTHNLVYS